MSAEKKAFYAAVKGGSPEAAAFGDEIGRELGFDREAALRATHFYIDYHSRDPEVAELVAENAALRAMLKALANNTEWRCTTNEAECCFCSCGIGADNEHGLNSAHRSDCIYSQVSAALTPPIRGEGS